MATVFQLVGLVAVCLGAATVAYGLLGVLFAVGVLVIGLGIVAFMVGNALELEEETDEVS